MDAWACSDVPRVTDLAGGKEWTETCATWLHGQVLTEEMRRIITNFLSTTRVRPRDRDVQAEQSDEVVSDEEVFVQPEDLKKVLQTKPGGRSAVDCGQEDNHHRNAIEAITRVQAIWAKDVRIDAKRRKIRHRDLPASALDAKEMCRDAAQEAQKHCLSSSHVGRLGSVEVKKLPTREEAMDWVRQSCAELSTEQSECMNRVVERCLVEQVEDNGRTVPRSEPLRWLTHGKPGVGKSKLIARIVRFFV